VSLTTSSPDASVASVVSPHVERLVLRTEDAVPFETIRIAASPDVDPKRVRDVVVIPGNPGVPAFYETYASRLWSELDGAANIEILGYLGHSADDIGGGGRWFTLERQLDHITTHLRGDRSFAARRAASMKHPTASSLHIVGHSIGAEMAMHALSNLGPERVARVVGLMPFVMCNLRSKTQRFLSFLVSIEPIVRLVAGLVSIASLLPNRLRRLLFRPITKTMDESAAALTLRWLSRGTSVVNMALMGRTEFLALAPPREDPRRLVFADRLAFIYCEDDHWAPTWQMREFAEAEGTEATEMALESDPGIEHAFVLSDDAAEKVAKTTAGMLL
jgi:pimeloyl-ACP methyl ester carboxylesterase